MFDVGIFKSTFTLERVSQLLRCANKVPSKIVSQLNFWVYEKSGSKI